VKGIKFKFTANYIEYGLLGYDDSRRFGIEKVTFIDFIGVSRVGNLGDSFEKWKFPFILRADVLCIRGFR
jgi:hypothetical protein